MGILLPVQIESYKRYEELLFTSIRTEAQKSTEVAANEARMHFKGNDVTVSIDGTWLTQGFSSLHGVGTIVSAADPPKVLDYEVLSRHCSHCSGLLVVKKFDGELYSELLEEHLKNGCEANHEGSSGGMEGASVSGSDSYHIDLFDHIDGHNVWTIRPKTQSALHCLYC